MKTKVVTYLIILLTALSLNGFKFFWQKSSDENPEKSKPAGGLRFFWQKDSLNDAKKTPAPVKPENISPSGSRVYTVTKYEDKKHLFKFYYNARAWQLSRDPTISPDGVQLLFRESLLGIGEENLTIAPSILIDSIDFSESRSMEEIKDDLVREIGDKWRERNIEIHNAFTRQNFIEINASTESVQKSEAKAKVRFLYILNAEAGKLYRIIMICKADEFGRAENVFERVVSTFEYFPNAANLKEKGKTIPPGIYNAYFKS